MFSSTIEIISSKFLENIQLTDSLWTSEICGIVPHLRLFALKTSVLLPGIKFNSKRNGKLGSD